MVACLLMDAGRCVPVQCIMLVLRWAAGQYAPACVRACLRGHISLVLPWAWPGYRHAHTQFRLAARQNVALIETLRVSDPAGISGV